MLDQKSSGTLQSLKNHFLVAMPSLNDSLFSHSVTYICDHNENGAMGLIINQATEVTMGEVFKQLGMEAFGPCAQNRVLSGGPVNPQQGLILHRKQGTWDSTLNITSDICLTASKDIMSALAEGRGPEEAQFILGYAGWSPGQLEDEIIENSWLTVNAESSIIFDIPPDKRWEATAAHLGIDLDLISPTSGRA